MENPKLVKNTSICMDETGIGLIGKKNRSLFTGIKKPTPNPPSVIASNRP